MAFRQLGAIGATIGLMLSVHVAFAQSPVERETARQLMHDGYALQAKGENAAALEAFRRAHAIMNVPTTGIEVGRSLAALGKIVEARDVLWRVARMKESPDDPPVYREAKEEARKLTESLAQRLASLRIVPRAPGYRISMDGTELSPAAIGVATKVDPGEHRITAQQDGRKTEVRIAVAEGETQDVPIVVETSALAPPPPPAPPPQERSPHRSGPSAWVWAGFIGAATSIVVGGVTGAVAIARKSDASPYCQGNRCLPAAQDALDSSRTFAGISTATFITGGALAVISGVLFFVERGRAPSSGSSAAAPFAASDHAGIFTSF